MKRDYEFYIYGETGAPTLVVHSVHFNDIAAIRRARVFAGERPFEVWCDFEHAELNKPLASTLVFRSFSKLQNSMSPSVHEITNRDIAQWASKYEFRLCSPSRMPLLFAGAFATDDQASDHARNLLHRHHEMLYAEVWRGMKLLRQV